MKKLPTILALLIGITLTFCTPPKEERLTEINLDLEDETLQRIYNFQDRQQVDSLYPYFRDKDPTYRYVSAMAFASIQAPEAIDSLATLLTDEIEGVRVAAAYALGQIGEDEATPLLTQAFERFDTSGQWVQANAAILEAIGKCGDSESLAALSSVSTYTPSDTVLLEGQAWGLYRFAYRGLIARAGTELMVEYATNPKYPASVRLIAANYLQRFDDLNLRSFDIPLLDALRTEKDSLVRMNLAVALGKTRTDTARIILINHLIAEKDYRVKCNVIKTLKNFDYAETAPVVFQQLDDSNYHIARTAATFFLENGKPEEARNYWRKAKDSLHWEVQLTLYRAANRYMPSYFTTSLNAINYELKQRFEKSNNPYEKAAAVRALGEFGWNYRYLKEKAFPSDAPVVRTACIEALIYSFDKEKRDFRKYFGGSYRQVRREVAQYLKEAIENGDPGMIAIAAQGLRLEGIFFDRTYENLDFLQAALEKLELPKEIETYNELKKTIDLINGKPEPEPKTPAYNHPINWDLLEDIPEDQQVEVQTNRGTFTLRLLPKKAPGTVANFLSLVKDGFYTDKVFHRVVTNFVAQGGCPRGDGYGALGYSIRSELPYLHYDAPGKIGMASSGKDTEGTQIFITHATAPHLDGRYTIFAEVIEGMEIIHQLQLGDRIQTLSPNWNL